MDYLLICSLFFNVAILIYARILYVEKENLKNQNSSLYDIARQQEELLETLNTPLSQVEPATASQSGRGWGPAKDHMEEFSKLLNEKIQGANVRIDKDKS